MINKLNTLLIGVGEAGGRLVSEIMKKDRRYNGLFINTSYQDINKLKNAKNIFVVPNADGTGRKRDVAKSYLKENSNAILDMINKFPLQNNIFFFFSFSGGTGSGMTPSLINALGSLNKEGIVERNINIVGILPDLEESKKAKRNAIECWNEVAKVSNKINMSFILDNSKRKTREEINEEFATMFDSMMNVSVADNEDIDARVIDEADVETLMSAKGSASIYILPDDCDSAKVGLAQAMESSIFAEYESDICDYLVISLLPSSNINRNDISKVFNPREDKFIDGSNNKCNIVIATGYNLALQKGTIELLEMSIKESHNTEEESIDIKDIMIESEVISKSKKAPIKSSNNQVNKKVDSKKLDDILNDDSFWDECFDL